MKQSERLEYVTGLAEFDRLGRDETFLDFVYTCVDLGWRGPSGAVEVSTSDPVLAALAAHWIRRLSRGRVSFALEFEEGQDVVEMVRFWAHRLAVGPDRLRLRRRRFGAGLAGIAGVAGLAGADGLREAMAPPDGTISIRAEDPILAARLEAWTDRVRKDWGEAVSDELSRLPAI